MREQAPVLFRAGRVVSPGSEDCEGFAVAAGRICATGSFSELTERFSQSPVIDLGDLTVIPGLNDSHAHFADAVQARLEVDVSPVHAPDVETLLKRVRSFADGSAQWVIAACYEDTTTGPLDRDLLDACVPEKPVLIRHVSCHWAVMNTAAMRALRIGEHEADIPGGSYGRDVRGRLTGHIYERALLARYVSGEGDVLAPVPLLDGALALGAYRQTADEWSSLGITSTCDAFVGPKQLGLHTEAHLSGVRQIRMSMLLAADRYDDFRALGLRTGFGDEWLRVAGVKAFVDGAVGGRTCLVAEPFCGTHDHGMEAMSIDELVALVEKVHNDGNRLAVHANGDEAIRRLLDALESAQRRNPKSTRHRIEHCSIVDDEIIARIARLGAMVTPFARYASFYGKSLAQWYGQARVERMFAHRSFIEAGITVGASTDHPASPLSPFAALQSMVTRTGEDGAGVGLNQTISVEDALGIYTVGSAETTGEAAIKGRLEPGYLADFVVLDKDPRRLPHDEIATTQVAATYVGGELVYEATA